MPTKYDDKINFTALVREGQKNKPNDLLYEVEKII
jgi:hypothetical protein